MSDRKSAVGNLKDQIEAARMLLATYEDILGDDADLRRDTVEGETDLHEAIRRGVGRIAEIDALQAGIKAHLAALKARASRLEHQEKYLRTAILVAMEIGGLKRLETPLGTVTRRAVAPAVVVTNEADIPAEFWKRADPTLDKQALLAALKALAEGQHIPGAELSNGGETIMIR